MTVVIFDPPPPTVVTVTESAAVTITEPGGPSTVTITEAVEHVTISEPADDPFVEVEEGDPQVVAISTEAEVSVQDSSTVVEATVLITEAITSVVEALGGPPGPAGPPGPPGPSDPALLGYIHTQSVPSASWTIDHPLLFVPNVTVLDTLDRVVLGQVSYPSSTRVVVDFSAAFSGRALLS